jgi:hypothetical protein
VYIKSKCGHSILLDTVSCWKKNNVLTRLFVGPTVFKIFVSFFSEKVNHPLIKVGLGRVLISTGV